jgi:hypothetical protein
MLMRRYLILGLSLSFAFLAAGCSWPPPYVFKKGEFNRQRESFGKEPTDITSVIICYNKRGSTPRQIRDLAVAECAKFNKVAEFEHQDHKTCPLSTPVSAYFFCHKASPGK